MCPKIKVGQFCVENCYLLRYRIYESTFPFLPSMAWPKRVAEREFFFITAQKRSLNIINIIKLHIGNGAKNKIKDKTWPKKQGGEKGKYFLWIFVLSRIDYGCTNSLSKSFENYCKSYPYLILCGNFGVCSYCWTLWSIWYSVL